MGKDPSCVSAEPLVYMQPDLQLHVHLGIFDFKLFAGLDFDFKQDKFSLEPLGLSSSSRRSTKKSKVILNEEYLENSFENQNEIYTDYKRKRHTKRGFFH